MLFPKAFFSSALVLVTSLQVYAHAGVTPALGVKRNFVRSNVQRPSAARSCGNINIAQNLGTSTPVPVAADGTFTVTATNFNTGRDGSRQFTVTVDPTAAGTNFQPATITKNGQLAPKSVGSEKIVAKLAPGTTCTGGQAGNLCLAAFKSAGGFGNCVVLQQGKAAATGAKANTAATRPKTHIKQKAVGTRAPRALLQALRSLEERGEEALAVAKLGVMNWIWV